MKISRFIHVEDTLEKRCVGFVTDGDEETLAGDLEALVRVDILQPCARDLHTIVRTQYFLDHSGCHEFDLRIVPHALFHDSGCTELVTAMHDGHLRAELRQIVRFLHGGVAPTDDDDLLVAKEEPIAGGAGRNAVTHQTRLRLQTQQTSRGPSGDDDRVCRVRYSLSVDLEGPLGEIDGCHRLELRLSTKLLRLFAEFLHHLRSHDPVGETGVVLHIRSDRQLATGLSSLQHEGREIRPCRVEGGGESSGP